MIHTDKVLTALNKTGISMVGGNVYVLYINMLADRGLGI